MTTICQREEVKKNWKNAKKDLEKQLKEATKMMKQHNNGKTPLTEKDVEILQRKIQGYQSALDKMNSKGEIDRMVERQKLEAERRKQGGEEL